MTMTVRKTFFRIGLSAVFFASASAQAQTCREPATGTKAVPALSPPLAQIVTGKGRLQFHAAPSTRCEMKGVFVIPNDELIAYAQTNDGWMSVTYTNPRTGQDVSGWVRAARLKETGTVGPRR